MCRSVGSLCEQLSSLSHCWDFEWDELSLFFLFFLAQPLKHLEIPVPEPLYLKKERKESCSTQSVVYYKHKSLLSNICLLIIWCSCLNLNRLLIRIISCCPGYEVSAKFDRKCCLLRSKLALSLHWRLDVYFLGNTFEFRALCLLLLWHDWVRREEEQKCIISLDIS